MGKKPNTKNETPILRIVFVERRFTIKGIKVNAIFPYEPEEKTMSLIQNMLIDSHIKNAEKP